MYKVIFLYKNNNCCCQLVNRCAGEIAAVPNTYCAVGVAYGAKVSGKKL